MRRRVSALLVAALLALSPAPGHAATGGDEPDRDDETFQGDANDDGLGVTGSDAGSGSGGQGSGDTSGNSDNSGSSGSSAVPLEVTDVTYVPTCSFNRPDGGNDALCGMATGVCPTEGDIAYWVFTRTRNTQSGAVTRWVRRSDPPWDCRGATDLPPSVPIEELIAEAIEDFASVELPRADVTVRPAGETLVNVETRFFTDTGTQTLDPIQVLGRAVRVRAIAERYDWTMGDGTTLSDAGAGTPEAPVRHVYRRSGPVGPYVTITWSGTFTVEGRAGTFPIRGTATTQGQPAELVVRTAQSELVRD